MSSVPNTDGIRSLRMTLDRLSAIEQSAAVLRNEIASRQGRLNKLQEEHADLAERVPKMLASMDLASSGNFGWETRIVWALRELATQYSQDP